MPVKQHASVSRRNLLALAYLRELGDNLRTFANTLNRPSSSLRIIRGDVPEDVLDPLSGFLGPRYCYHVPMRRAISSFEIVRFVSESTSPRSTIA